MNLMPQLLQGVLGMGYRVRRSVERRGLRVSCRLRSRERIWLVWRGQDQEKPVRFSCRAFRGSKNTRRTTEESGR